MKARVFLIHNFRFTITRSYVRSKYATVIANSDSDRNHMPNTAILIDFSPNFHREGAPLRVNERNYIISEVIPEISGESGVTIIAQCDVELIIDATRKEILNFYFKAKQEQAIRAWIAGCTSQD